MAISDRFLQRSNQSPSSYKEYLMTTDNPTPEGYSGFLERTENIQAIPAEEKRTRLEMQYLEALMDKGDPQIKDMIGSLLSAGVPIRDIIMQVQNYMQEGDVGGQIAAGEPGMGMSSEFRELIGQLSAAGVSKEEILRIIQSRMDAMTGGVPDVGGRLAAGAPVSRFNQGGIVSLRHLTRPIGI